MSERVNQAILFLAHGTKEIEASQPVFEYAKALSEELNMRVEGCLREFIEPSIPTVVKKLIEDGVEKIYVLPFFLFKSGHVTRDIEEDIQAEREKHAHVEFVVGEPVGFDPRLVSVLKARAKDVLSR